MEVTQKVLEQIVSGKEICKRYKDKYFVDSRFYFVFLFSGNEEIDIYTLYFLPLLRKEKEIPKFIIVSSDLKRKRIVEDNIRVPFDFVLCSEEERNDIGKYFLLGMGKRYERAIINSTGCIDEKKIFELIGCNGITAREIVALGLFNYREVPSNSEIEASLAENVSIRRGIDWTKHAEFIECMAKPNYFTSDCEKDEVDFLIENGKLTQDDLVILFSVTLTTKKIIRKLQGFNIVAVLDNNEQLSGTLCEGISVYTPIEFLNRKQSNEYKIIVPTRSYRIICEQLLQYGYELGKQVFVTYRENFMGDLNTVSDIMMLGELVYKTIRDKYPEQKIYLAPYPGTGDMFLIGMYLRERMQYDEIQECVLVSCLPSSKKIMDLFDLGDLILENIVLQNQTEMDVLMFFTRGYGYDKANFSVMNDGFGLYEILPFRGLRGLDFNSMFQRVVFRSRSKITKPELCMKSADTLFEQNHLRKGKTILLSPYANTVTNLSVDIWEKLANGLLRKGYDVCTNISGNERPIKGTKGIFIPYSKLVDFLNQSGGLIALRSGLCDIAGFTTAMKVILYPSEPLSYQVTYYDYFSLKLMGIADDNILELIYEENQSDNIQNKILKSFRDEK